MPSVRIFRAEEFPPLPDGLFWDIRYWGSQRCYAVELRRKLPIGSVSAAWTVLVRYKRPTVNDLRSALKWAMGDEDFLKACQKQDERNRLKGK